MPHSTPGPGPQGVTVLRLSCTRSPLPALVWHTGLAQPQPLGNILASCPTNRRGCFSQDSGPRGPPPPSSQGREQMLIRTVPWQATAPLANPLRTLAERHLVGHKTRSRGRLTTEGRGLGSVVGGESRCTGGNLFFPLGAKRPRRRDTSSARQPGTGQVARGPRARDQASKHARPPARPPASRAHVKVARAASGRVKATIVRRPSRGCLSPRVLSSDTG